jgi:hypothetical protein
MIGWIGDVDSPLRLQGLRGQLIVIRHARQIGRYPPGAAIAHVIGLYNEIIRDLALQAHTPLKDTRQSAGIVRDGHKRGSRIGETGSGRSREIVGSEEGIRLRQHRIAINIVQAIRIAVLQKAGRQSVTGRSYGGAILENQV